MPEPGKATEPALDQGQITPLQPVPVGRNRPVTLSRSSELREVGSTAFALVASWDLDLADYYTGMQGEMHRPAALELWTLTIRDGAVHVH